MLFRSQEKLQKHEETRNKEKHEITKGKQFIHLFKTKKQDPKQEIKKAIDALKVPIKKKHPFKPTIIKETPKPHPQINEEVDRSTPIEFTKKEESIVFELGSNISISRLCTRSSKYSRESL